MPFFTVTMTHPDGPGWGEQAKPHVDYLKELVGRGVLQASGPVLDLRTRAGFLIFRAADRHKVDTLIAADPFAVHGLIETLEIREWDPLFGAFADQSSGQLAGRPVDEF